MQNFTWHKLEFSDLHISDKRSNAAEDQKNGVRQFADDRREKPVVRVVNQNKEDDERRDGDDQKEKSGEQA